MTISPPATLLGRPSPSRVTARSCTTTCEFAGKVPNSLKLSDTHVQRTTKTQRCGQQEMTCKSKRFSSLHTEPRCPQ